MKNSCRILLSLSTLLFLGVGIASADSMSVISYSLCSGACLTGGPATATFDLSTMPAPIAFTNGADFKVIPQNLMINGSLSNDVLLFYNTASGGALGAFSSGSSFDFSLTGPQLYTGTEGNPILSIFTGSIQLFDFNTGKFFGTLTETNVPTPEPSALGLLSVGILAMGLTAMGLKRKFPIAVS